MTCETYDDLCAICGDVWTICGIWWAICGDLSGLASCVELWGLVGHCGGCGERSLFGFLTTHLFGYSCLMSHFDAENTFWPR